MLFEVAIAARLQHQRCVFAFKSQKVGLFQRTKPVYSLKFAMSFIHTLYKLRSVGAWT